MTWLKQLIIKAVLALPAVGVAGGAPAKLYKNPNCGCCAEYAKYLERNGFDVEVIDTHDLAAVKQKHGVPAPLEGCHTVLIQNYVVEGHVPVESINRLLQERAMITGIAVPGMPLGSPGMSGDKQGPLEVYVIGRGEPQLYATH